MGYRRSYSGPGVTAPEPWRELPPPPPIRPPADPDEPTGRSEFGWGAGLVPPQDNGLPPSYGGQYTPRAPELELPPGSLRPREKRRPKGQVTGYPGERVG